MLSRRGWDSRRNRLRYSRQKAVANCNRRADCQRGTRNYVPRVMFFDIFQQGEGLEDRRDVEVDQRTAAHYNVDISEESRSIEVVDENLLD